MDKTKKICSFVKSFEKAILTKEVQVCAILLRIERQISLLKKQPKGVLLNLISFVLCKRTTQNYQLTNGRITPTDRWSSKCSKSPTNLTPRKTTLQQTYAIKSKISTLTQTGKQIYGPYVFSTSLPSLVYTVLSKMSHNFLLNFNVQSLSQYIIENIWKSFSISAYVGSS